MPRSKLEQIDQGFFKQQRETQPSIKSGTSYPKDSLESAKDPRNIYDIREKMEDSVDSLQLPQPIKRQNRLESNNFEQADFDSDSNYSSELKDI